MNEGQNCWRSCGKLQGPCAWCGTAGMCCKIGWKGNGCDGSMGTTRYHGCVRGKGNWGGLVSTIQYHTIQSYLDVTEASVIRLKNVGKNCWRSCGKKQGPCAWCGTQGMCCRIGWKKGNGCDGEMGTTAGYHSCVKGKGNLGGLVSNFTDFRQSTTGNVLPVTHYSNINFK